MLYISLQVFLDLSINRMSEEAFASAMALASSYVGDKDGEA